MANRIWDFKPLGEMFDTTSGGTPLRSHKDYYNGEIAWLKSGELNDNQNIVDAEEHITSEAIENSSAKLFPSDTVLIAMYGATTGKLGIARKEVTTNQAVCGVLPNKNFLPKIVFYYLLSKRRYLIQQGKGGAQPNISQSIIKQLEFPEIPYEEQEKIAEGIETQFTRLESTIKSLKAVKAKLSICRKSVLKAAFDMRFVGSKVSTDEKCIKDIASIKGGKRLPKGQGVKDARTPFPYIRVTDFENYSVNTQSLKFISESAQKQISRYVIFDNEVYISIAGTIGRVGIIPSELNGANLTENAAKLTDIKGILPKYVMYFLSSPMAKELISFSTKSTSQPKLALFRIGNLKIKYPIDEVIQERIVEEIESRFSVIDKLETVIDASLLKAETLRKSILKSAFEGKLVN